MKRVNYIKILCLVGRSNKNHDLMKADAFHCKSATNNFEKLAKLHLRVTSVEFYLKNWRFKF
jgi:hypothetical protein